MKILIKSLAGGNFHLDAELTDTIGTIKSKIQNEQGHAPELQKIIFSGKILTDDKTVADCKIKEKDFLVVMVSKPKAPKPATAGASTSVAAPEKPTEAAPAPAPDTARAAAEAPKAQDAAVPTSDSSSPATTATAAATAATAAAAAAADAPASAESATPSSAQTQQPSGTSGSFLTGGALESAMQSMVEMGFERDQVQRAMRAAFNNPDRAVEYLMTGIPEHLVNPPAAAAEAAARTSSEGQQTPASGATPGTPAAPAPAGAAGGSRVAATPATPATPTPAGRAGNLFEAAAAAQAGRGGGAARAGTGDSSGSGGGAGVLGEDDGSGEQVIDLGNPAMLAQLQQLVQQNPAALQPLVHAIAQSNPQLAEAMNHDPQGVLALLAGGAAAADDIDLPTLAELDEPDRASVQQIVAMGIPEAKAIECYFMCGKNVEMAVQYYFENPQDFDD